jgi:hypothetical protein
MLPRRALSGTGVGGLASRAGGRCGGGAGGGFCAASEPLASTNSTITAAAMRRARRRLATHAHQILISAEQRPEHQQHRHGIGRRQDGREERGDHNGIAILTAKPGSRCPMPPES